MTTPEAPTDPAVDAASASVDFVQTRDLADQMSQPELPFDAATLRQAVIQSIQTSTVTVTLSGDSTQIPGVKYAYNYGPKVGDTVNILQQGADLIIWDSVANGATNWVSPTTTGGWVGHDLTYRLVNSHGAMKVEWKGLVDGSGSTSHVLSAVGSSYRPSVVRYVLTGRGRGNGQGDNSVTLVFNVNGTVDLAYAAGYNLNGNNSDAAYSDFQSPGTSDSANPSSSTGSSSAATGTSSNDAGYSDSQSVSGSTSSQSVSGGTSSNDAGFSDTQNSGQLSQAGTDLGHAHYTGSHSHSCSSGSHSHSFSAGSHQHYTGSHSHSISSSHSHSISISHTHGHSATHRHYTGPHSHSITMTAPDWVSFDGVTYFL